MNHDTTMPICRCVVCQKAKALAEMDKLHTPMSKWIPAPIYRIGCQCVYCDTHRILRESIPIPEIDITK